MKTGGGAFAVIVSPFSTSRFRAFQTLKFCQGRKRVYMDTPGTNDIRKTPKAKVEKGQQFQQVYQKGQPLEQVSHTSPFRRKDPQKSPVFFRIAVKDLTDPKG